MKREYYSDSIEDFLTASQDEILGKLAAASQFSLEQTQTVAWQEQISILKTTLSSHKGYIYFEYSIPRMGQRIDVVVLTGPVIFVLEFKVGESKFNSCGVDQVWDYALDLKNFHEPSHMCFIAPILIATKAKQTEFSVVTTPQSNKLLFPIKTNSEMLNEVINTVLNFVEGEDIDYDLWQNGRYCPTPTIIEAAMVLYSEHSVDNISRSDAAAINLKQTSNAVSNIIYDSKENSQKSICFVTGVPGAGKTLVGLNIATTHIDKNNDLYSVFLSGNGPLVSILREALARPCPKRVLAYFL